MRSLTLALFALAFVALASAEVNTSNFTCVGNPYFTAPYNSNPVDMKAPNQTQLDLWNITFNETTQIYNFTNFTGLSQCKGLNATGSCCHPGLLNRSTTEFAKLLDATSNATVRMFEKRANHLKSYGKAYGKIIGNLVNLASIIHGNGFRLARNAGKLLNDANILAKVLIIANATNCSEALKQALNGSMDAIMAVPSVQLLDFSYQVLNVVAGPAGLKPEDIAQIFGGIKVLIQVAASFPPGQLINFDLFPSVDKAIFSDTMDSLYRILGEVGNRMVNVTLNLTGGPKPAPAPAPAVKRRMLAAIIADTDPKVKAEPAPPKVAASINFMMPIILDIRNIELIGKIILAAIGNETNANQTFKNILTNNVAIYKDINATIISNQTNLQDFKAGGDWSTIRTLFITIAKLPFDESIKKVVSVAENKKKCMQTVFQYQGYIGCLACDPSAVATGKVRLNATTGTFAPVISSKFGELIRLNCVEYLKDLVFIKNFVTGMNAFSKLNNDTAKAQKTPKEIDANMTNIPPPPNGTLDLDFNMPCSLNDPSCTWIQTHIVDNWGPTTSFLCDFSSDDCDLLEAIKGFRNPFMNKTVVPPPPPPKRRMLEETVDTSVTVTYDNSTDDDVSNTTVGFDTTTNYTVNSSETADVTADTTQQNSTDAGDNTTNTTTNTTTNDTSNTSNVTNASNASNGTGDFALKSYVSIPFIVATIIALLL